MNKLRDNSADAKPRVATLTMPKVRTDLLVRISGYDAFTSLLRFFNPMLALNPALVLMNGSSEAICMRAFCVYECTTSSGWVTMKVRKHSTTVWGSRFISAA